MCVPSRRIVQTLSPLHQRNATSPITCAAYNTKRNHIASSDSKHIYLSSLRREIRRVALPEGARISNLIYVEKQDMYIATSTTLVKILTAAISPCVEFKAHEAPICASVLHQERCELVTACDKGDVRVWEIKVASACTLCGSR